MVDDDDSDSAPAPPAARGVPPATALSVPPTRPPRLGLARSLADVVPGQVILVDARGRALTLSEVRSAKTFIWALRLGISLPLGITTGVVHSPIVGAIAGIGLLALTLWEARQDPAYRAAFYYFHSYRWEDARSAFLALERKRLPTTNRAHGQVALAAVEALLGQPQAAVDRLERARKDVWPWVSHGRLLRCQIAAERAKALATLGRFDEAWRARDDLIRQAAALSGGAKRPRGDYLDMIVQTTELKIAADAGQPEALPDDDTLHRWARAALGRTSFGEMLVSLAWAFHRRGDDDMAHHLLAEALLRIPRWSLDKTSPRLHAWAMATAK